MISAIMSARAASRIHLLTDSVATAVLTVVIRILVLFLRSEEARLCLYEEP